MLNERRSVVVVNSFHNPKSEETGSASDDRLITDGATKLLRGAKRCLRQPVKGGVSQEVDASLPAPELG
jgi:hypothetical protein